MSVKSKIFLAAMMAAPGSLLAAQCAPLLDHEFRYLGQEKSVRLCEEFAGDVLLVVNTASKCGFTPQYEGLEAMQAQLKDQGFSVVGFPSNDFGGQEPGTEKQIQDFCRLTYSVQFPMFEKSHVKGPEASALYKGLAEAGGGTPKWNFYKYLIGRDGKLIKSYSSMTTPDDKDLQAAIAAEIAKPRPE